MSTTESKQAGARTQHKQAQNPQEKALQVILANTCWCGAKAQWHGDQHGLRVFACKACAEQQGAEV